MHGRVSPPAPWYQSFWPFSKSPSSSIVLTILRLAGELDVIGLGGAAERARQAEPVQRSLGHAFDARGVRRLAARVRVVGEAADLHRVLRRAVAREADEVQAQRPAHPVQAGGEFGLVADGVVRARRREEAALAAVGREAAAGL